MSSKSSSKTRLLAFILAAVALLSILTFTACNTTYFLELSDSKEDVFCRTFIGYVIAGEKEQAFAMVSEIADPSECEEMWKTLREIANASSDAQIHQTGFELLKYDGVSFEKGYYFVEFNNGASMNLSLTFTEHDDAIQEMRYLEVTDVIKELKEPSRVLGIVATVVSILFIAFTVWMIVDCARRRIRKKPLWIILIIAGISITLSIGFESNISFFIGLMMQFSRVKMDLSLPGMMIRFVIPVGAIVYFFMRKQLTITPLPQITVPVENTLYTDTYTTVDMGTDQNNPTDGSAAE